MAWKIYYNPKCSKCRETLALLRKQEIEPEIIEYLKAPLSVDLLQDLAQKIGCTAEGLLRKKEPEFDEAKVDLGSENAIFEFIVQHPNVLERPIVDNGSQAVIARPPELAKQLF